MFYDQISRVFTYNGTQVFINGERKLVHGINRAGHPLYAQRTERAVLFFLIDGEQRQYLSTVNADTSVELSNAPAVLDQVLNADGSVSILQNKKFLSAAQTSNAFTFMPRAITMEKFFLSKSNFVDVSSENVFTVRTFFGTSLFLDDAFKLKHKPAINKTESDLRIYVREFEKSFSFFVLENNAVKYIRAVGNDGSAFLCDEPVMLQTVRNVFDDSFSIKCGELFLSAQKDNGTFITAKRSLDPDHLFLDKCMTLEPDNTRVALMLTDVKELDAALARLDRNNVTVTAVAINGIDKPTAVELQAKKKIPVATFDGIDEIIINNRNCFWLLSGRSVEDNRKAADYLRARLNHAVPADHIINFSLKMPVNPSWIANVKAAVEGDHDLLVLGNVQTLVGINASMLLGHKPVHLASDGQDIRQAYLVARHVFEGNRSIKCVIIGLTLEFMTGADDDHFSKRGRDCRYLFTDGGSSLDDRIFYSMMNHNIAFNLKDVKPEPDQNNLRRALNTGGAFNSLMSNDEVAINDSALHYLERLIELCIENGAKPVAVLMPARNQPIEKINLLRRIVEYQSKIWGFPLLDFSKLPFRNDQFFVPSRLTLVAAAQLTNVLNLRLSKLNLFPIALMRRLPYDQLVRMRILLERSEYSSMIDQILSLTVEDLKRKDKIKIGFVVYDPAMWSGDALYRMFERSERFEPTLFLCLRMDETSSLIADVYHKGLELFKGKGINIIGVDNHETKIPKQDVLFYLTPYFNHLPKAFRLGRLKPDTLLTYLPYGLNVSLWAIKDFRINYLTLKTFVCTKELRDRLINHNHLDPSRLTYSGHPKMDIFLSNERTALQYEWKTVQPDAIKIIWAPHWSVGEVGILGFSTFKQNYKFLFEYAKAHPETSWVFKPHPQLLYSAVQSRLFPTEDAFKEYMAAWDSLPNARVATGGYYQSIFASSDGMILDSGSFIAEYQFVQKPMLFLTRPTTKHNRLGNAILEANYTVDGGDLNGIKHFIEDVLLNRHDPKAAARRKVFDEELNYVRDNGMLASEKIFHTIDDILQP